MKFATKLKALAEINNVEFKEFSEYHIQLKALYSVNIYESKNTFYINGMAGKVKFDPSNPLFLVKLSLGNADFSYPHQTDKRKSFKKSKRLILWQKNPVCFYCHELIHDYKTATTEHKIPLCKGGSNRNDNLALSHHECNQKRGNSIGVKSEL